MKANPSRGRDDLKAAPNLVELNNQLNRAYLAGDGAAVERTMALITAATRQQAVPADA